MGFLSGFFNKKNNKIQEDLPRIDEVMQPDTTNEAREKVTFDFPEGEIVPFDSQDGVLDVTSIEQIERFKHNLQVLIEEAKRKGKIDKFIIVREDNFFPEGWEWRVLADNTNLEQITTNLSYQIRERYALQQMGIEPYTELFGEKIPNLSITHEKTMEALSRVDKKIASVLLPSRFRSTKHFTVNTPLGITGDYNFVEMDRNFIVMDDIANFLNSGYAYSVGYRDAYLDVSHEGLPISENAVVLINDEKYDEIVSDEKRAAELKGRKVVRFKGNEIIAIDMMLTQMGALPSRVGASYAFYDKETLEILDKSIRELALDNDLLFNRSHSGELVPNSEKSGHFSNYYDDKNQDYNKALNEFYTFLQQRFPECAEKISGFSFSRNSIADEIIDEIGIDALLEAIDAYNQLASDNLKKRLDKYYEDRKKITPEIHQTFTHTVRLIGRFYEENTEIVSPELEQSIQMFFQGKTVGEQLEASKKVQEFLRSKVKTNDEERDDISSKRITPKSAFKTSLQDITISDIKEAEDIERSGVAQGKSLEEVEKDD